ncbi:ATP-binding protein [Streptomyces sp. NPDC057555]|uniref:PAS domain-containing sensor histidine kinase n=1 Tax=Streptomyces sp. NPDC057555 TaxID=3346166 RepID=UPI0036A03D2F
MDRTRDRLQAVLEALPRAAIVQSGDAHVVAVNRRFIELFGLAGVDHSPGAPLGPVVEEVAGRFAVRPDPIGARSTALAARRVHRAAEFPLADGRIIRRETAPLYDADGRPFGTLWTAEDVTEAKRREHALHRDNAALAELARRRNEFLATASHNLRTPLTSVLSFCDLLADPASGPLGPEQREFLAAIRRNAERMASVITALLEAAAVRDPRHRLEFGTVDVPAMVEHAVLDRMPTLTAAGVFTVLRCRPGPPLHGDAHRLAQVLDNLLENAAKFTPPGGRVEIDAAADDDTWRIEVADTGIGVPEQYREEIFSGFVRAPNAEHGGYPGTGLGLAFSRDIVRRHGGELTVSGTPGRGAVFTLRVPTGGPGPQDAENGTDPR